VPEQNNKIKIFHIINTFNLGGAEMNLFNLLKAFPKDDYELHVGYSYGGNFEEDFRNLGVKLFKYSEKKAKVKSFRSFINIIKLARYLKRHRIRIVHTHNFSAHVWGSLAAKLVGVKVVEHVHDSRYEEPEYLKANDRNPNQFRLVRYFTKLSDRILILTKNNHDFLLRYKMANEGKIRFQKNGISLESSPVADKNEVLTKLNIPERKRIILMAARISREKNVYMVLDLASALKERYPEILFIIAGEGPLKEDIEKEIKMRDLSEHVRLLGFYPQVYEILNIAEVFILPSLMELHSITILESLSMQKPTLVSRGVGCNDDFIAHGVNGYLLDPNAPKEWIETIDLLLKNPAKAQDIALAGRRLVEEKGNIKKIVQELGAVYQELCDHHE